MSGHDFTKMPIQEGMFLDYKEVEFSRQKFTTETKPVTTSGNLVSANYTNNFSELNFYFEQEYFNYFTALDFLVYNVF